MQLKRGATHGSLTPPAGQRHARGGFACCLHQGASGRCWVSEAGFLIVWSPAHGHRGKLPLPEISHCSFSVWLQMLPLPTGCYPAWVPHRYDRWRTNMREPRLVEGSNCGKTLQLTFGESATDINAAFVVPAKSLCGKWVQELQGTMESEEEISLSLETVVPVVAISMITGCDCIPWLSSSEGKTTRNQGFVFI